MRRVMCVGLLALLVGCGGGGGGALTAARWNEAVRSGNIAGYPLTPQSFRLVFAAASFEHPGQDVEVNGPIPANNSMQDGDTLVAGQSFTVTVSLYSGPWTGTQPSGSLLAQTSETVTLPTTWPPASFFWDGSQSGNYPMFVSNRPPYFVLGKG